MSLKDRLTSAWNAFQSEPARQEESYTQQQSYVSSIGDYGIGGYYRQDRRRTHYNSERSILNLVFNRIANDIASTKILHVRVDENDEYRETIKSGLNDCMTLSANLDQTARDFWVDVVLSMLDEGVITAVPIDTDRSLDRNNSFDILSMRTGRIVQWMPYHVKIEVYNERTGNRETITLPKEKVAILENPFYSIMNEPNSTLKRLVYKMNLLDQLDGKNASSKLNLLIKLPYSLKSPTRMAQAEERKQKIEEQLTKSKYGIAYIDQTEQITQLGRAIESDLPEQIEKLTEQLYNQIGISGDVFRGTSNAEQNLAYNKKVLKPILDTIELEFTRKFLTPTARTQGQKIKSFIDAFDMVTPTEIGEMANSLSRNEIVSANEFRSVLGLKPSDDPRSDQLLNKNMPISQPPQQMPPTDDSTESTEENLDEETVKNRLAELDSLDQSIDDAMAHAESYYDPVERHERYLREKAKLGIGSKPKSSQASKLRSESKARISAMQEATNRRQADADSRLNKRVNRLYSKQGRLERETRRFQQKSINAAESRGKAQEFKEKTQAIQSKIGKLATATGEKKAQLANDLKMYISNERKALENILSTGSTKKSKENKEQVDTSTSAISKRADAIYRRRYKD
jgi:hypothetical protein